MPKIISYTPPWLSRPSSGAQAFITAPDHDTAHPTHSTRLASPSRENAPQPYYGPHRLLARRGTEIFVVVKNQIRWLDLRTVKDDWEEQLQQLSYRSSSHGDPDNDQAGSYRILNAPVYQQIRQLLVSPSGNFLAILAEHTVHVAVLPDSSHLEARDRSPLKIKTHQLGPTTHVLPQSSVVAALWHPLACSTTSLDCLVTVTAEAAVRVWELDRSNTWSFDRPSLAIDLRKLADGNSCDEDFEPSGFGKSRGFSADTFEMEVSTACFGGPGREEEDGWAAMTLWVGMRNGDVYALCPLLPSRWRPTSTLIPSLSTSVVSSMACLDDDTVDPDRKRAVQQQFEWVQEIDGQEPIHLDADTSLLGSVEVRSRPAGPSAIPRLQGPFLFELGENELDLDVSDLHVVAAKVNAEDILSGEEEDYADLEGLIQDRLSATVISLATTTGKVHVCLDLEGVSGQWLPTTKKGAFSVPVGEPKELVLVETLRPGGNEIDSQNWPLFSQDPLNPYDFYLTSSRQINYLSLSSWASRLETELLSPDALESGQDFRLKVLCGDQILLAEDILEIEPDQKNSSTHLSNPLILHSPELGYMLLTGSGLGPHAVIFDNPDPVSRTLILARAQTNSLSPSTPRDRTDAYTPSPDSIAAPPRCAYEPAAVFYDPPTGPLKQLLSSNVPQRHRASLKQEIRLSPSTLDIMTAAHRILAYQTSQLEQAAAELFRRCERLREELGDQVRQMAEISERIHRGNPGPENNSEDHNTRCENRISRARDRQRTLTERYEALRRKVGRATAGGRELSNKEKAWMNEMDNLGATFGVDSEIEDVEMPDTTMDDRFQTVRGIAESLLSEFESLQDFKKPDSLSASKASIPSVSSTVSTGSLISNLAAGVPAKLQRAKIEEAMQMVEREAAVIEAVMARLVRLGGH